MTMATNVLVQLTPAGTEHQAEAPLLLLPTLVAFDVLPRWHLCR